MSSSQSFSTPWPSNPHPTHRPSCSSSPTFPTLLPHLSPPPFPSCHLTPLNHLSHLATSPLSPTFPTLPPHLSPLPLPPCHFTSLPTFPTSPSSHLLQVSTSPSSHLSNLRSPLASHLLSSLPLCTEI